MSRHELTIRRPDRYYAVTCRCGFHVECLCDEDAARDAAKEHLGIPARVTA